MTDTQKPVDQQPIQQQPQVPQQPGVPYQPPVQVQYVVSEKSLEGLGGWLIFWLICFALSAILYIGAFFGAIDKAGSGASFALVLIFSPIIAGLSIASIILIALRKKLGKWVSIGTFGASALYFVISVIVNLDTIGDRIGATIAGLLIVLLIHGLFALYFIVSKRVQLTLTR